MCSNRRYPANEENDTMDGWYRPSCRHFINGTALQFNLISPIQMTTLRSLKKFSVSEKGTSEVSSSQDKQKIKYCDIVELS